MNNSLKLFTLLFLGSALFAACDKDHDEDVINGTDIYYVTKAYANGISEIGLGNVAVDSSDDATIKAFGQKMIADYTNIQQGLQSVATSLNFPGTGSPEPEYLQFRTRLLAAKDRTFDSLYIHNRVAAHEKAIVLFHNVINLGTQSPLKNFAEQTLPKLIENHQAAKSIAAGY